MKYFVLIFIAAVCLTSCDTVDSAMQNVEGAGVSVHRDANGQLVTDINTSIRVSDPNKNGLTK